MTALNLSFATHCHVVAQVIEAELIVRAIGNVGAVLCALMGRIVIARNDQANVEAHELVDLSHPLGVTSGEVVVHRYLMHTAAR